MMPELRDYQREAVEFLRNRTAAGLLLDMGLGKTASTLSALEPRHLPAIVIAPKRVAEEVWEPEARIWRPDLRVRVVAGTPRQRRAALLESADIYVIGRDNSADVEPLAALGLFRTLILDELSGYKSPSARRTKSCRRIRKGVSHVWGLTGTPAPNGYLDLWSQMYLLDGGERLGPTMTGYRSQFFDPGRQLASGVITEWTPKPGAHQIIDSLLATLCLSMSTAGRVELPPVTHNQVRVPLPSDARKVYNRMERDLYADLRSSGGEVHTAANAAVKSSKLSQLTAGFMYHDGAEDPSARTTIHKSKVMALTEIVEGTGSPVLVAYRFKAERDMIRAAIGSKAHTIEEPGIIGKWNRGEIPVLLVHPASAGHGLNLQHGGHTIVWTSPPWSLEEWQQTNKRLARSGQDNPVVIHSLISPHTVDEAIVERLTTKTSVQTALLRYLEDSHR